MEAFSYEENYTATCGRGHINMHSRWIWLKFDVILDEADYTPAAPWALGWGSGWLLSPAVSFLSSSKTIASSACRNSLS